MDTEALDALVIDMGGGSELLMTSMLALMMFAVALGLKPSQFAFFKKDPKHYLAGVLAQILGLPLLTLALVFLVKPAPSIALGMILVACCPGGNISNLLAMFGRANTALSVSLTATSSLAAAFITPVSILFWSSLYPPTNDLLHTINFDALAFLQQAMLILALPIALGMLTAYKLPALAARLQKPLGLLAGGILCAVIIVSFYKFRDLIPLLFWMIVPLVILHNGLAFGLGYACGLLTKADIPTRRALTFEVGIQNSGLGWVILITQFSGLGGAAAVTGMWGLWHIVAGSIMIGAFRLADRRRGYAHV